MSSKVFALVDCNSFYVSCERVFHPAFKNKPVVVLSNNDGCAISRSQLGYVQVFIETNPFKGHYYRNSASIDVTPPTAYTPQLVEIAKRLLSRIYKEGYRYKSCGVMLTNFSNENLVQQDLFKPVYSESPNQRLMKVMDGYNRLANSGQLFFAAEGAGKPWFMKQSRKSKRFTTRWDELLEIRI